MDTQPFADPLLILAQLVDTLLEILVCYERNGILMLSRGRVGLAYEQFCCLHLYTHQFVSTREYAKLSC